MKQRRVTGNRRNCWVWLLMPQLDVAAFLENLMPLLRVKHERAEEAVNDIRERERTRLEMLAFELRFTQEHLL